MEIDENELGIETEILVIFSGKCMEAKNDKEQFTNSCEHLRCFHVPDARSTQLSNPLGH